MPILINEVHTEVVDTPADDVPQGQPGVSDIPTEWLQMNCLLKERQARLEDD
mgnify:CR=1 FL=1